MKLIDVLWIEDDQRYVNSVLYYLKTKKDEIQFTVLPWHHRSWESMENQEELELDKISMGCILVDYHLETTVTGDEIIKRIRSHKINDDIPIIFYSGGKNIEELEALIASHKNISFSQKDTLKDDIILILTNMPG